MYASDIKHPSRTLEDKLNALYTLSGKKNLALDLFREPYIQLLKSFCNPHKHLPPVIHVAGTNGKGSTIAFLRSIYEAAGYKVHVYTSPHLVRFNERIVLAGQQIDDETLEALIDETLALNEGRDATFFEATTAMAFAAFTRVPADICLLEVGLGGRLDCTNIIESPAASVITSIGMDHTDYLGDTIEKIASEKAGIIKQNCPCIIGKQKYETTHAVFENISTQKNAPLTDATQTNTALCENLSLPGAHQIENAQTALTVIETLQNRFPVSGAQIKQGLQTATWPARLQRLKSESFGLPENISLWLDGGHNEDAAQILSAHVQSLDAPVHLVCGMLNHKDPGGFLRHILPHVQSATATQIVGEPKTISPPTLYKILQETSDSTALYEAPDYKAALQNLGKTIKAPAHILIAGSLYLAGHVLKDIEQR